MVIFNSYVKLPEGNESLTTGDCIHKHLQTVMFVVYDGHFNRENELLNHWNWAEDSRSAAFPSLRA